jgi:V/A-type H+-transporting ATPase subunit E
MEKVSKKILDDAKKKALEIRKKGEQKADELREKLKEELSRIEKEIDEEIKEKRERERERLIGMKSREMRMRILKLKRELIEELFSDVIDKIIKRKDYLGIIENFMEKVVDKTGEVIIGDNEERINRRFINEINGKKGWNLTIAKERYPLRGGFILRQGKTEINLSIDALIEEKRDELEIELAKLIW